MTTIRLENFKKGDNWKAYVQQLNSFIVLNDIPIEKQKALLITQLSTPVYEILSNLCYPSSPQDTKFSFSDLVKKLEDYFHTDGEYTARFELMQKRQGHQELKEYRIKEPLKNGMKSEALCFKLFKAAGSSKDLVKIAHEVEWEQTETFTKKSHSSENTQKGGLYAVSQFRRTQTGARSRVLNRQARHKSLFQKQVNGRASTKFCYCCGKNDHFAKKCFLKLKYCSKCGKQGRTFKMSKLQNESSEPIADAHHHSSLATTMLEPATRLSTGTEFTSNLQSFPCAVQPNRLPLRPAPPVPRRKSNFILCPARLKLSFDGDEKTYKSSDEQFKVKHVTDSDVNDGQKRLENNDTNGVEDNDDASDNQPQNTLQSENTTDQLTEPTRDGVDTHEIPSVTSNNHRSNNSPRPRIIEDVIVSETHTTKSNDTEAVHGKMVPPLRLKKIAVDKRNESLSLPLLPETNNKENTKTTSNGSKYRIIAPKPDKIVNGQTMGAQKSNDNNNGCASSSIEIMIPSVPELGIRETRTDRISVHGSTQKPFIVNYVREKEFQYPVLTPITMPSIITTITPDPGGQQQRKPVQNQESPQRDVNANLNHSKSSLLSMPSLDDFDDTSTISDSTLNISGNFSGESTPNSGSGEWLLRRQRLGEKFYDMREKVKDSRHKIRVRASMLSEDNPQIAKIQETIDECDRQINHYSNLLAKLSEANNLSKYENFCEEAKEMIKYVNEELSPKVQKSRKSVERNGGDVTPIRDDSREDETEDDISPNRLTIVMTSSPVKEARQSYNNVSSEQENSERVTPMLPKVATPTTTTTTTTVQDIDDAVTAKRKIPTNGFSSIPRELEALSESRANSAREQSQPVVAEHSFVTQRTSPQTKSVIVQPALRTSSEPALSLQPPISQPPTRAYSSFMIDDLNATPTPTTSSTVTTILQPSVATYPLHSSVGARAPPNSPREAVIATSVPADWAADNGTTTMTDVEASGYHQRQEQQQDERRPLDLAIKTLKRTSNNESMEKDEKKKKKRVTDTTHTWPPSSYASISQPMYVHHLQQPLQPHHPSVISRAEPYPYVVQPTPPTALWSPAEMLPRPPTQRQTHILVEPNQISPRTMEYRNATKPKSVPAVECKEYGSGREYMTEQTKAHQSVPKSSPNTSSPNPTNNYQRRPSSKPSLSVPVATTPLRPLLYNSASSLEILEQVAANVRAQQQSQSDQQQQQQQTRIMAEQFPTLGNWVAGLAKKQVTDSTATTSNTASTMKKETAESSSSYNETMRARTEAIKNFNKTYTGDITAEIAAAAAMQVANGNVALRWPTPDQQQQQARSFQQMPLVGGPLPQTFYPQILPYPAKIPMDLYQKAPIVGYAPYPYHTHVAYSRLPPGLDATPTLAATPVSQQQRVPPLLPLTTTTASLLDPMAEKRLQQHAAAQQRYYATPENPARLPYANYGRRGSLSLDFSSPEQQAQYAKMLAGQAAVRDMVNYEQQQQQQRIAAAQHQQMKAPTPERSTGRQYKNSGNVYGHNVMQTSRSGSVIGSTSSTPTSVYSTTNGVIGPRHRQHEPPRLLNRECPTPNLGEVNRSPSGLQGLRCSNCGVPGARFECLGCETTFYCNETCQTQHWPSHVTQCPKIMPRLKKVG